MIETVTSINFINHDKLNSFFITLSDLFLYILENGPTTVEINSIKFDSKHTASAFAVGFDCILHGIDPYITETILATNTLMVLKNENISEQELFELKLLEKIIPLLQNFDYMKFLDLQWQLCSVHIRSSIEPKFKKYLPTQYCHESASSISVIKSS